MADAVVRSGAHRQVANHTSASGNGKYGARGFDPQVLIDDGQAIRRGEQSDKKIRTVLVRYRARFGFIEAAVVVQVKVDFEVSRAGLGGIVDTAGVPIEEDIAAE